MIERVVRNDEVVGLIPICSTIFLAGLGSARGKHTQLSLSNFMETIKGIRVIIVEDQTMVSEFLAAQCAELGLKVISKPHNCAQARAALQAHTADLLLLDLSLPDGDGLSLVPECLRTFPKMKVIAISARVDAYTLFQVKRLGVHGFIDKINQPSNALNRAITDVMSGKNYFAPIVATAVDNPRAYTKLLTESQIQILALIGEAKTDEEIAAVTGKVPSTIQSRRRDIMAKLKLHSTAKLMHYAIANGITSLPAGKMLQSPAGTST